KLCGLHCCGLQRFHGCETSFDKEGQFVVQINARNEGPIREIRAGHDLDSCPVHGFNQFEVLEMDRAAAFRLFWIAAPQDKSSVIRHEPGHIPGSVSDEAGEKRLAGFAAILRNCLLNSLGGSALSIEGTLQKYFHMLETLCPGIRCLGHADSFNS